VRVISMRGPKSKSPPQGRAPRSLPVLTFKQRKLLELMLEGVPDKACAAEFGVTYSAIRKRIEGMFTKFGVRSRIELAKVYYRPPDTGEIITVENTIYPGASAPAILPPA